MNLSNGYELVNLEVFEENTLVTNRKYIYSPWGVWWQSGSTSVDIAAPIYSILMAEGVMNRGFGLGYTSECKEGKEIGRRADANTFREH